MRSRKCKQLCFTQCHSNDMRGHCDTTSIPARMPQFGKPLEKPASSSLVEIICNWHHWTMQLQSTRREQQSFQTCQRFSQWRPPCGLTMILFDPYWQKCERLAAKSCPKMSGQHWNQQRLKIILPIHPGCKTHVILPQLLPVVNCHHNCLLKST